MCHLAEAISQSGYVILGHRKWLRKNVIWLKLFSSSLASVHRVFSFISPKKHQSLRSKIFLCTVLHLRSVCRGALYYSLVFTEIIWTECEGNFLLFSIAPVAKRPWTSRSQSKSLLGKSSSGVDENIIINYNVYEAAKFQRPLSSKHIQTTR